MPDLWFVAGLVIGVAISGFCAVGSFDRGADSVRRGTWSLELAARQRAVIAAQNRAQRLEAGLNSHRTLIGRVDRARRGLIRRLTTRDSYLQQGVVRAADVASVVA